MGQEIWTSSATAISSKRAWCVAAALVFWKALRSPAAFRRTLFALGITLAVFGGSDIVEAHTGAWWRPWWLLVWKAACVLGLLVAFVRYFQLNKTERRRERGINDE